MSRSTRLPAKAADIPKKKIASENAQPTAKVLIPIACAIASLKDDQQYTVPIEQCIKRAGTAARIHLFSNISFLLLSYRHFCAVVYVALYLVIHVRSASVYYAECHPLENPTLFRFIAVSKPFVPTWCYPYV